MEEPGCRVWEGRPEPQSYHLAQVWLWPGDCCSPLRAVSSRGRSWACRQHEAPREIQDAAEGHRGGRPPHCCALPLPGSPHCPGLAPCLGGYRVGVPISCQMADASRPPGWRLACCLTRMVPGTLAEWPGAESARPSAARLLPVPLIAHALGIVCLPDTLFRAGLPGARGARALRRAVPEAESVTDEDEAAVPAVLGARTLMERPSHSLQQARSSVNWGPIYQARALVFRAGRVPAEIWLLPGSGPTCVQFYDISVLWRTSH